MNLAANRIVLIVHYFPPLNSAGGKRMEAMAKYFSRAGRAVTVITTRKRSSDGPLSERLPEGITVISLGFLGRLGPSQVPMEKNGTATNGENGWMRALKTKVMRWCGQLPDPRLPFAFAFLSPFLAEKARAALARADVVVTSNPPWPVLLAARFVRWRFGSRTILDYRDHFSECHEMPGSAVAKAVETMADSWLCRGADGLVVVSEPMACYYRRWHAHVDVVPNGFDHEIMREVRASATWRRIAGKAVTLRYMGVVTPDRVPRNMITGLAAATRSGALSSQNVRFEYYGDCSMVEQHIKERQPELAPFFHFLSPVPYRAALKLMVESDYLLFAENSSQITLSAQGILTTKLFEYLAGGRPVVADISPQTLAGQLLLRAEAGHLVSAEASEFEAFFRSPCFHLPPATFDPPFVRTLSRASQAEDYLGILDRLCSTTE